MKLSFLVISIVFCNSVFAQFGQLVLSLPKEEIYWSQDQRLSWTDFKGGQWKMDAKYTATTVGGISTQYEVPGDVVIVTSRSTFNKALSAFRSGYETTFILQHEQLHFDIYELFCRKLKKAFTEMGPINSETPGFDLEKIKSAIYKACADTQHAYDEECYRFPEKQKDWVNKIAVEIESLKEFRDPVVRLPITH